MTAPFTVCPYRFSADPPAMVAFLDLVGLRREITTAGDGFAVLRGRRGKVAVHAAATGAVTGVPAGRTSLAFVVDDAVAATAALAADGFEVACWDESYAKQGAVRDPFGHGVWLNEPVRDLHGYVGHEPAPSLVDVVAVHWSPDFDALRSLPRAARVHRPAAGARRLVAAGGGRRRRPGRVCTPTTASPRPARGRPTTRSPRRRWSG